jgi:glucose/arabinose dehydrogenase
VLAAALAVAGCGGDAPKRGELVPIGAGLRGPEGYTASVYATGLKHVSAFALDPRGRLWVSTSGAT